MYYPINEESACRAKEMTSFSDYRPGSKTAEYKRMVDQAVELGERQKKRVDPMYHEKIDRLVDTYARRLAANFNEESRIGAMCPSVMISGGSVVVNTAENRLQIIFDGKPDGDIRDKLKTNGFRWAPSQGAWQRQLTDNALRAARHLPFLAKIEP